MNRLLAAVAVFVLALAGVGGLRLVWAPVADIPRTARLALGFCAGTFLLSVLFFLAYLAGLPFSRLLVLGPMLALAVGGLLVMLPKGLPGEITNETPWLAGLLVVLALALSWSRPIHGYDAIMMWGLKAKMMYFARTWSATMFDPFTTAHTDYPPVVPSAQAFVFFWLGEFDDVASRVVFAAWFAAGAGILWWLLNQLRTSSRTLWLMWWCALPVAMSQVDLTYADWPLAVYALVFYGAVLAWLREPARRDWLRLAGVFGGMAFWVKQDAMLGVGAGIAALLVLATVKKLSCASILQTVLIVAVIAAPWRVFVWARNLPNDFAFTMSDIPAKTGLIAASLFHFLFIEGGFAFFWPVLALVLVLHRRRLRETEPAWLAGSALIYVLMVFGIYWCSKDNLMPLLQTSMERVLIGLFVPGLLLGARLWHGRFRILRREIGVFVVALAAVAVMFWAGYQVEFALMNKCILAIAAIGMVFQFLKTRRHGAAAIGRTIQFGVVMATLCFAVTEAGIHAGTCGELCRVFQGKTLAEQHLAVLPPPLRAQMAQALTTFPPGTHINVLPKRSLWRHIFYYETFPDLVMDNLATNVIHLTPQ